MSRYEMVFIILPTRFEDKARLCQLTLGSSTYQGMLFDLPRHVETYKTLDSEQYFKTNDVGQMIIIFEDVSEMEKYKDNVCYPDGLTKPLEVGVGERYDG
ncbi:transcription initiation factor TFIID subunit [Blastocystis sp. subtype 4]|uniref:transcription initiation factor TFIID subunit n=1 Tax=Blastocystis sp. subtype 4 TaxID=944170 RepID=UPI00071180F8|nr:transcription initiation factor TFIID subunit [Blastocystis sp. subtype 4]KNB43008.1 transcription initiation factor TFIID subunit [Blastocystis sp. subtype 4]|eukprot:XP_014526451.1 transcription initiation factor TFIID subunit [Blastocystis sp. subtype 4]